MASKAINMIDDKRHLILIDADFQHMAEACRGSTKATRHRIAIAPPSYHFSSRLVLLMDEFVMADFMPMTCRTCSCRHTYIC
jgi:hypothetical protein